MSDIELKEMIELLRELEATLRSAVAQAEKNAAGVELERPILVQQVA